MKYKAMETPYYALKAGLTSLPKRVSFYGAAPIPSEAYEVKYSPSIEMTDSRGRVTYSNYFYGKTIKTFDEAQEASKKLNA